jgi:hypothetical protein
MTEELITLLVANTRINQYFPTTRIDEQATHRPIAKIVFIGWHPFLPQNFGNNTKHSPTIELEVPAMYNMDFHD